MSWALADGLEVRRWEGGAVAYCEPSGDTHRLSPAAAEVVAALAAGGEAGDSVVLHHLARAGLVEAKTPSRVRERAGAIASRWEGDGTGDCVLGTPSSSRPAAEPPQGERDVTFATGPFVVRLHSGIAAVAEAVSLFYADRIVDDRPFADFHIALVRPHGLRRWVRPQVWFDFDGARPFRPLPLDQAPAVLEWGLNWCIAAHAHSWLVLHAAAVARDGRAVLLPGPPGAGKSTLAAALALSGWRLLSDELALLSLDASAVMPLDRPANLKNRSIDVIRGRFAAAVFGPTMADTAKGRVALLKNPAASGPPAAPVAIVVPCFAAGEAAILEPMAKADACLLLGEHSFNYSILGRRGFEAAARLVESCGCWRLTYGDLDRALPLVAGLLSP